MKKCVNKYLQRYILESYIEHNNFPIEQMVEKRSEDIRKYNLAINEDASQDDKSVY